MFAVEVYAAVRRFVFIEGNSRREAARIFGLNRETVAKMCRFSLPPGYVRTKPMDRTRRLSKAGGAASQNRARSRKIEDIVEGFYNGAVRYSFAGILRNRFRI